MKQVNLNAVNMQELTNVEMMDIEGGNRIAWEVVKWLLGQIALEQAEEHYPRHFIHNDWNYPNCDGA